MEVIHVDDVESHVEPTTVDYQEKPMSLRPRTEPDPTNYLTPEKLKDPLLARYKPIERRQATKRTSQNPPSLNAVFANLEDYLSATLW
jgi:hypothetical protein